jgi:protein-S-isoprenylcysteine O-methyltransferase Ste14
MRWRLRSFSCCDTRISALLAAWAAYLGTAWAFLGPVVFIAFLTRFQIMPEERVLQAKFGAAYADYRARVRRWV